MVCADADADRGVASPLGVIIGEGLVGGIDVTPAHDVGAKEEVVVVVEGVSDLVRSVSFVDRKSVGKGVIWRPVDINSRTWFSTC